MAVQIMIQFDGKNLTIPINPEKLQINKSASNNDIEIIGLGPVARKGTPGLETTVIESFFPGPNSYYYKGVLPLTCINFIEKIWNTENKNNNVAKIITTGLPKNLNMPFVIDNFDYDNRAGEEEDVYFELKIKRYVPYGAKTVNTELTGLAAARAVSPAVENTQPNQNIYTVQNGDCLWNIAKAATGNGANWPELYNLNTAVIGSNPNLIKPGQVLTLPNGWSIPGQVPKLRNISNSKSKSSAAYVATPTSNQPSNVSPQEVISVTSQYIQPSSSRLVNAWLNDVKSGTVESKPIKRTGASRSF